MSFGELALELERIIDRYDRAGQSEAELVGRTRDVATAAGWRLIEAVQAEMVALPDDPPSWLKYYAMRVPFRVRFHGLICPWGYTSLGRQVREGLEIELSCVVDKMRSLASTSLDMVRNPGTSPEADGAFEARHVFLEAAVSWLPLLRPMEPPPTVKEWKVIGVGGEAYHFVSDFVRRRENTGELSLAIPIANACLRACRVLAGLTLEAGPSAGGGAGGRSPIARKGGLDVGKARQLYSAVAAMPKGTAVPATKVYKGLGKKMQFLARHRQPPGARPRPDKLVEVDVVEKGVHFTRESVLSWLSHYLKIDTPPQADASP